MDKDLRRIKDDKAKCIQLTNDGGYIVAGSTNSGDGDVWGNHGDVDVWVIKLNNMGDTLWTKCYGGSGFETANAIYQTYDSGYIFAGYTSSGDGDVINYSGEGKDGWYVKTDKNGNIEWSGCIGLNIPNFYISEYINSIIQTDDGGYVLCGDISSFYSDGNVYPNYSVYIKKLDNNGNIVWNYGKSGSSFGDDTYPINLSSIKQLNNGDYIAVGYQEIIIQETWEYLGDKIWVIKLDSTGNTKWSRYYGDNYSNYGIDIVQIDESNYMVSSDVLAYPIVGNTFQMDLMLLGLNTNGDTLWSKQLGGDFNDYGRSIQHTSNGDIIIAGYSESNEGDVHDNHGSSDFWVVKIGNPCNHIAPYYENFDDTEENALPYCWNKIIPESDYDWNISVSEMGEFTPSPPNALVFRNGMDSLVRIAITPPFSDLPTQKNRIRFQLGGSSDCDCDTSDYVLIVGTMSDPTNENTFVPFKTFNYLPFSFHEYIVDFDTSYTRNDLYIAIKSAQKCCYQWVWIDNFTYEPIPLNTPKPATLPYLENWETSNGTLDTDDTVYKQDSYFWSFETDKPGEGRARWGKNAYKKNSGKGALTLDHNSVSGDTAVNYATLTINLSDYQNTDLELAFSWADHNDEENPNDKVWIRGSVQDEWLVIYDLDPVSAPDNVYREVQDLDIDSVLADASPPQSVSTSFQVRFGQEDNYMTLWDGISFDDIRIYETNPCLLSPVTLPFLDDFEAYSGIQNTDTVYCFTDHEWRFDTDHQGEGRARWGTKAYLKNSGYGALTLDHLPSSGDLATNFAILTLNMSDYADSNLELAFAWTDSGNENHPNDKVWVRGSMEDDWVEIYDLDPESEPDGIYHEVQGLDIDKALASAAPPQTVSSTFQIRFGQQDEYSTPWDGISYDDVRVSLVFPCNLSAITLPFTEDWESYKGIRHTDSTYCMSGYAWSFDTDHQGEGRARWGTYAALNNSGTGALTMDHLPSSGDIAKNASVLTLNLSNYTSSENLELSFWWADHNDEDNPGDKVWIRGNPEDDWVEIFDLNPETTNDNEYQQVSGLDIDAVLGSASPAQTVSSTFQIRFGQEDNYSTFWDGISFDDIVLEENLFKSSEITEKDVKGNENISVYYSNGYIHIKSFGDAVFENKYALIYDIYGQMIANQNVPPGSVYKIKVNPCSCYMIIKIRSNSQVKVEKVLVW